MNKNLLFVCVSFLILAPLTGWAQPSAFDIAGSVKTVEKKEGREMDLPRGDVEIEEDSKVLEIHLRRTNPTVSGAVTVRWVVVIKDVRGTLRPITKGKQEIVVDVGIPTKLESDPFSVKTASFDFRGGGDGKMEQEVEGYAILVLDREGQELGSKFQPKSLEDKAREVMVDPAPAPQEKPGNNDRQNPPRRRRMKM